MMSFLPRLSLLALGCGLLLVCGLLWQGRREALERAEAAEAALRAQQQATHAAEAALNAWQAARENTRTKEAARAHTLEQLAGEADRPLAARWHDLERLFDDLARGDAGNASGGPAAGGTAAP